MDVASQRHKRLLLQQNEKEPEERLFYGWLKILKRTFTSEFMLYDDSPRLNAPSELRTPCVMFYFRATRSTTVCYL